MRFQDLLVYVRQDGSDEPMEIATRLAKAHHAHLTGLFALHGVAMLKLVSRAGSATIGETFVKEEYAKSKAAEQRFREIAARAGVSHVWLSGEGAPTELLDMFGRLQDLIIVGHAPPDLPDFGPDVAESMVLVRGQATLVIPHTGTFPTVGKRIVIAWNGSREAAAAVRAARPLIQEAEVVTVLSGQSRETFSSVTHLPRSAVPPLDLVAYLLRRTNRLDVQNFDTSDAEAGSAILDRASRLDADLIVMGAYGRPWLRQWILGGATRQVLSRMEVPVLMAR